MPLGKEYTKRRTKTRAVAFISEKSDFTEEIKTLRAAGRFSAKREELRIGIIYDKKVIKKYKQRYGSTWFPEVSYDTFVLKRYDGEVFFADFVEGNQMQSP